MSRALAISSTVVCAALAACAGGDPPDPGPKPDVPPVLTEQEWSVAKTLSPIPDLPPDPTNAYADDPRAAALGQRLFFDASVGSMLVDESGRVSCATCHSGPALDDRRSTNDVSMGAQWGGRNALPIVNSSFYRWSGWGGRFDSQWSLVLGAAENDKVVGTSRLQIAHLLFQRYRAEYDAIFAPLDPDLGGTRFPAVGKPGSPIWEMMAPGDQQIITRIFVNYGKAIAAYMRRLVTRNAPFDRWVAGDRTAISESAARGFQVFLAKGCVECHKGPRFTDEQFHWDGTEQIGPHVPATDNGRLDDFAGLLASPFKRGSQWSDAPDTADKLPLISTVPRSVFRTKSLRDIGTSAPYMHCGQFQTLEAVIDHYRGEGASSEPPAIVQQPSNSGGSSSSSSSSGGYGGGGSSPPPSSTPPPDPPPARFVSLEPAEKADLVSFLKTLDGEPLDPRLLRAEGP